MATVVAVMDRPGWTRNTDNIVVADPVSRSLTWIPRDLWCAALGNRINAAFKLGGHAALRAALTEHGVSVRHGLCLAREAVAAALRDTSVRVPVEEHLRFWYPLDPLRPVEDGRKLVEFVPPAEVLTGERIHQWVGARLVVDGAGSDLSRIARQQVLIRRLLEDGFDFGRALAEPTLVSLTEPDALDDLRQVRADWEFATLDDVEPKTIDGMAVLVRRSL